MEQLSGREGGREGVAKVLDIKWGLEMFFSVMREKVVYWTDW